jgi:hypothetical protein
MTTSLAGLSTPTPPSIPQIEVAFEVDAADIVILFAENQCFDLNTLGIL